MSNFTTDTKSSNAAGALADIGHRDSGDIKSSSAAGGLADVDLKDFRRGGEKINPLKGEANYQLWAHSIRTFFDGYAVGELLQDNWRAQLGIPPGISIQEMPRADRQVISAARWIIYQSIDQDLQSLIMDYSIPCDVWRVLRENFQSKGPTMLHDLRTKRYAVTYKDTGNAWEDFKRLLGEHRDNMTKASHLGVNFGELTKEQGLKMEICYELSTFPRERFSHFVDITLKDLDRYKNMYEFRGDAAEWVREHSA